MSVLDALIRRLPGSVGVRDGRGWSVGVTPAADLPLCELAREGEERRHVGSGGTASAKKRCNWTGAAYAWQENALTDHDHSIALDDLSDVTITTPATGQLLQWNGSVWIDGPRFLTNTKTWDIANMANGDDENTTLTVTGAAVGDACFCGVTSLTAALGGAAAGVWELICNVSATDTCAVNVSNETGTTLNPASGTLRCWVLKP